MLLAVTVWALTGAIVYCFAGKFWWFPPPISQHAIVYDQQFNSTLVITGVIFTAAQAALGWACMKYKDDGKRAAYSHGNNTMEALWTSATAVLFVGLVLMGTTIWANVHLTEAPADALQVEALGKQFKFYFRYPGPDGKLGKTDIKQINDANSNPFGVDEKDPAGKDDIQSTIIAAPSGKPVRLLLKAQDVIHNFFVRELRLKQDMVPGMEIPFSFTADKVGDYEIACSELCGQGHSQMKSILKVMTPDDFEKWKLAQVQK